MRMNNKIVLPNNDKHTNVPNEEDIQSIDIGHDLVHYAISMNEHPKNETNQFDQHDLFSAL
jgi:hypothetical protein